MQNRKTWVENRAEWVPIVKETGRKVLADKSAKVTPAASATAAWWWPRIVFWKGVYY